MVFYDMFKKFGLSKELSEPEEIEKYLKKATKRAKNALADELSNLNISTYKYSITYAVDELGLDEELIQSLVEDFVAQIIKAKPIFLMHISDLKKCQTNNQALDYTLLRNLAHKNLGVARNLRIEHIQKILNELMTKDNLEYLEICTKTLESCIIMLQPEVAYKTAKMIEIKISL